MKKVWILADDRAGNVSQLLGIAESLGWPFDRKDIRYNRWIRLPNWIRASSLAGLDKKSRLEIKGPWPDVVLSAGRRSFPVARFIKRKSKGKTKIVQLMNPGATQIRYADLLVLPKHDRYNHTHSNVMIITGTPNRITPAVLSQAYSKWHKVLTKKAPLVSVIVGGATKNKPFSIDMAKELVSGIKSLNPGTVCVTTSRRTPGDVVSYLKQNLPCVRLFYEYGNPSENPYFGLLACADVLVVTGDSMSMCSECCTTGKPVYIFAPDDMMSEKHKRFHQELYTAGYAVNLKDIFKEQISDRKFQNPADLIADRIRKLIA